jgi:hypothetical protein
MDRCKSAEAGAIILWSSFGSPFVYSSDEALAQRLDLIIADHLRPVTVADSIRR